MASALKDSRTLFAELDGDNSGTIDEAEFGKLLAAMSLDVQPGQFASIDKDSSGSIEYGEFEAWSEENGLQQSADALRAGWCAVLGRDQASMVLEVEKQTTICADPSFVPDKVLFPAGGAVAARAGRLGGGCCGDAQRSAGD